MPSTEILWTILADQDCQFWPLKVSSTMSEEDSQKSKSVNHGMAIKQLRCFIQQVRIPLRIFSPSRHTVGGNLAETAAMREDLVRARISTHSAED